MGLYLSVPSVCLERSESVYLKLQAQGLSPKLKPQATCTGARFQARKHQKTPEGPRMHQKATEGTSRHQKAPEATRRLQKAPGGTRKPQKAPASPKGSRRPQKAPESQ